MMRYGYTRQEQDKAAAEIITGYREAAALFPILRQTAEAWDGKVYNKRFTEALNAATGQRIFSQVYGETIHFYLYGKHNHQHTIMSIKKSALMDGKRLDAKTLIDDARSRREEFLRRAADIENAGQKVDTVKEQIETLKNMLRVLGDSLPYEAREIWGVNIRF
ncbi:MAG: hypothetical protein J6N53_07915 [Lachnospiraceae bacterium]|nr:hypothetical protein [Lachnospiraceae bacterium]MBP3296701.1 hypothetical protein [Lachnospiraceae bacterium]